MTSLVEDSAYVGSFSHGGVWFHPRPVKVVRRPLTAQQQATYKRADMTDFFTMQRLLWTPRAKRNWTVAP